MTKMQSTAQYPVAGAQNLRPKSGRIPLQPKNSAPTPVSDLPKFITKPKQEFIEISRLGVCNKENRAITAKIESFDASLAEELSAIKKKLDRLRVDRARTEKMLKERDMTLELQMKELLERGQIQKEQEIEVDRLFRLKELRSYCMRVSPIRSLREREKGKKIKDGQLLEMNVDDGEESVDESTPQNISLASSELTTEK